MLYKIRIIFFSTESSSASFYRGQNFYLQVEIENYTQFV